MIIMGRWFDAPPSALQKTAENPFHYRDPDTSCWVYLGNLYTYTFFYIRLSWVYPIRIYPTIWLCIRKNKLHHISITSPKLWSFLNPRLFSMGISGSWTGGTLVPYVWPYFVRIFPYIGLKNRPKIYGRYLQSIGSWVMAIDVWGLLCQTHRKVQFWRWVEPGTSVPWRSTPPVNATIGWSTMFNWGFRNHPVVFHD